MSAIRSKDTKMEIAFRKALFNQGIRFRKHARDLRGNPDIAIKNKRAVIFLDSCFWHRCPKHFRQPSSNKRYWNKKIKRNVARDKEVSTHYKSIGWKVMRFWEHEVEHNLGRATNKVANFLKGC